MTAPWSGASGINQLCRGGSYGPAENRVGVPAEEQERIFETFYVDTLLTRQLEGTGLGLAVAPRFVELHHGRRRVASQVDQGSTFFCTMPCTL